MKLRRLQLYHFRGFEDLQIQFPADAKTIVFIGENGCGKTSLLEGMSMILRDVLHKHHRYDAVDWNRADDVNSASQYGKIEIGLQGAKRGYDFTRSLSADRTRFISEEKLALELGRDLTDEDRIEHYEKQAEMAFDAGLYEKALGFYHNLAKVQELNKDIVNNNLIHTCYKIGYCYICLKNYNEALIYLNKTADIYNRIENLSLKKRIKYIHRDYYVFSEVQLTETYFFIGLCYLEAHEYEEALSYWDAALSFHYTRKFYFYSNYFMDFEFDIYFRMGIAYYRTDKYSEALDFFLKTLKRCKNLFEITDKRFLYIYRWLKRTHEKMNNTKNASIYQRKIDDYEEKNKNTAEIQESDIHNDDITASKHFDEYIDALIPIILHYSAGQTTDLENFKNDLPMAFRIPMTTNFDMISDWFIEYENDENRKRLRVNDKYRGVELETIREVIRRGLSLLNGADDSTFSELRTEIDENVKDGQVSTWLSISKNGTRLNVKQLSDGEKRVLVLLIDITRRLINAAKQNKTTKYLAGAGIVIIDEIDQHLHPKWQRNLLPTLNTLFPHLQFIVATHSPLVLGYLKQWKEVAAYKIKEGKTIPIHNFYGRNAIDLFWELHEIEARPKEIQDKIEKLYDLFDKDQIKEAKLLLKELSEVLGENDAIVNELTTSITLMEELQ